MKAKYNTSNRQKFLQAAQSFKEPFSAKDIETALQEQTSPMGLSTIYRLLDDYSSDGTLRKLLGDDGAVRYFYLEPCHSCDHFYLECERCHQLTHIDCRHLHSFARHLAKRHSFKVSNYNLVVSGICANCAEKEK